MEWGTHEKYTVSVPVYIGCFVFNPTDSRKSGESCALGGLSAWSLSRDSRDGQHGGMIVQVKQKLILPNWLTSRRVRGWLDQVVSSIKCRFSGVKGHEAQNILSASFLSLSEQWIYLPNLLN